jgi:hypothetical protein
MTDDGFNTGFLYRGERKPYQPSMGKGAKKPADLEKGFAI